MACSSRRFALLVLFLTAATAVSSRADDLLAAPTAPAKKADKPAPPRPRVLVTISKETTYITEPLRADGYPDYVAALNQRFSEGVTPENNSAVLFWKAVGPGEIKKEHREKYFQMLGIPPLPEKGDYYIHPDEYAQRQRKTQKPAVASLEKNCRDPIWDQQQTASGRPWSKEQFPVLAGWLSANEKPLALLAEASKRPKRYDPLISGKRGCIFEIMDTGMAVVSAHRGVARALIPRAMLRANEGRIEEACDDLLTCHRLGRLMGQGPTLVDSLVGITLDAMACGGERVLLQQGKLSATQIAKMRQSLDRLLPLPKMADKIDVPERFFGLECVVLMAREGPSRFATLTGGAVPDTVAKSLVDPVLGAVIDWDIVLRMLNSWYDRIVEVMRKPSHIDGKNSIDKMQEDVRKLQKVPIDLVWLGLSVLGNPRQTISEQVGESLVTLLMPALPACAGAEHRAAMQFDLTKLAFALAAYRADNGSYPKKLADLKPKYVADVPKDIFNDADLHYRRDGNGYLLYSVGPNGKDDGGKGYEDRKEGDVDSDDMAVRMPAK